MSPESSEPARARLAPHVLDLGEGAWVAMIEGWLPDHARVMEALVRTLPLHVEMLRIGAREVATPRRTSWHGDPGTTYAYSGRSFDPSPWTAELSAIRDALERTTGVRFGSVLVNEYRGGRDSMGWHADDEPELGPRAPDDVLIASVSLGARRRFVLRHRRRTSDRHEWSLGEGDLLVMGGATQKRWRHAVPKTAKPVGARMNLTYRIVR